MKQETKILPLDGPLPRYVQVIGCDGWGGTWCSTCILTVLEQEVFGFDFPVQIRRLMALGLRIDPTHLLLRYRPVVVIQESPEEICLICDIVKLQKRAKA